MIRMFDNGTLAIQSDSSGGTSMRCVRVSELLAEELPEPTDFFLSERKGLPAEAVASEPKTKTAASEGSDDE